MEQYLRDYHTRRILSDIYPFEYNGSMYYITYPTAEFKFYAEKIYVETYQNAKEENISTDNIIVLLDKYKMWNESDENSLSTIKRELDDTKVSLFNNYSEEEKIPIYKKVISDLKTENNRLSFKKQSMDYLTAEYSASSARQKFLIGSSILKPNKKRLWNKISDWDKENNIIDVAVEHFIDNRLNDLDIRDIVKNEPWKTIWSLCRKPQIVFRKNIGDFTDEQQSICVWSIIYDNIGKSADAPRAAIIEDDDALDGWMICQRRKNEIEEGKAEMSNKIIDPKVSRSQEIFIMADNVSNAQKVYNMNDFGGKIAFKKRMLQIQRDKWIDEVNMIETREHIIMEANNRRK